MVNSDQHVYFSGLSCEFGDTQCSFKDIEHFESQCATAGLETDLTQMGCNTFWKMTQPLQQYIYQAVKATLSKCALAPEAIDRVIFATSDDNLRWFSRDTVGEVLTALGLSNCTPMVVSLQQCASSLTALDTGKSLLTQGQAKNVLVVNFDFAVDDSRRITSFALFGDAVISYLLSTDPISSLTVGHSVIGVDYAGFSGKDDFASRVAVSKKVYDNIFAHYGSLADDIERFFSTNTYRPVATMSASLSGIHRSKLDIDTLKDRAHCGICDWAINLENYLHQGEGYRVIEAGKKFAVQASAPGFFACTILESV